MSSPEDKHPRRTSDDAPRAREIRISPTNLAGDLLLPGNATGIVLFAHGSGSSRFSSRNRFVARLLEQAGFATLLLDLLTPEEEEADLPTGQFRFDIQLLSERLIQATSWLAVDPETRALPVGYFGASTGAGAALVAAAALPEKIKAVVSRGGRPDLAAEKLARVQAPTLLIVGSRDEPVLRLNEAALGHLNSVRKLEIVPRATHLFEEPGALEEVARLASGWFERYLKRVSAVSG